LTYIGCWRRTPGPRQEDPAADSPRFIQILCVLHLQQAALVTARLMSQLGLSLGVGTPSQAAQLEAYPICSEGAFSEF